MDRQNDADRREALSRAMRRSSGTGGGHGGVGGKSVGNALVPCLLLAVLLGGGLLSFRYAGSEAPFYVSVGDRSGKEQDGEEQEGMAQETSGGEIAEEEGTNEKPAGNGADDILGQNEGERAPYKVPEVVRVLLMNSDFSSVYHEQLVLKGRTGEAAVTAAMLGENFDEVSERFLQEGLLLQRDKERYVLSALGGEVGSESREAASAEAQSGEWKVQEERLHILSISRACGTPSYRGKLYLYVRDDRLVLVNELSLEEYLYSVLPSEMPASYQAEALKAQAVCARTYACAVMENPRYPEFDAHLDDSTSCQVYGNLAEHENTTAAAEQTRGEILLFQERPVSTYYYSTSCGIGSDMSVWQGFLTEDYPYLSNRSLNAAHEELSLADDTEFAAYLASEHQDVESGYPWYRWNCQVTGVDADAIYEKIKERYQVKQESVVLVGGETQNEAADLLPHPGRIRMLSVAGRSPSGCAVCLLVEGEECSYRIYGEYNIRYLLCDGETTVTRQDGSTTVMRTILPSAYLILTPLLDKEEFIGYSIMGGGYGHGVGMSQNGADALAASGMGYRDILAYYYIGAELKTQQ